MGILEMDFQRILGVPFFIVVLTPSCCANVHLEIYVTSIVAGQLFFILPVSNQDTQLKRMGLATLPRILCAFDVFDTHADGCRLPTHVLILGPRKGNKTFSELDLKSKKVDFLVISSDLFFF